MQETYTNNDLNNFDDELDLREIFYILLGGKWVIVSVTTFALIIGITISLLLPNIYESRALLVPVKQSNGIAGSLANYSSLAGIAGISLPVDSDENNSAQAIKKIESLSFFKNNILSNIHLPDLMAVKSWNPKTNIVVYDKNIYDTNTNTWIRDYSYPQQQIPSAQESFEKFIEDHLSLSEEKKTGFITISIKHQSPFVAQQWLDLIFNEINIFYRHKDKLESEKASSYLNEQILETSFSEIKEVLALLLQEEIKKLTLAESKKNYVFDYIDPPAVMEEKSEPNRALICILSLLLGGILSILSVLIMHYNKVNRNS